MNGSRACAPAAARSGRGARAAASGGSSASASPHPGTGRGRREGQAENQDGAPERAKGTSFLLPGRSKKGVHGDDPPYSREAPGKHVSGEIIRPRLRLKWGDRLEFVAEAGPGDFIYVPPYVPHQEINARDDEPLSCVLVRSGQEPVAVNLDLPNVEPNPETVECVEDLRPPERA